MGQVSKKKQVICSGIDSVLSETKTEMGQNKIGAEDEIPGTMEIPAQWNSSPTLGVIVTEVSFCGNKP